MTASSTTPDKTLASGPTLGQRLRGMLRTPEFGIFAFLIICSAVIGILRPTFLTADNILNMGRQMSVTCIMAVAMTFLITAQELDLSVGSILGFCSMGMALVTQTFGVNIWIPLPFRCSLQSGWA